MASNILQLHHVRTLPTIHPISKILISQPLTNHIHVKQFTIKCTSNPTPESSDPNFLSPTPTSETTISPEKFPIEKRRKSEIIRDRKSRTGLVKQDPPNFEIGWKRTKPINLEKPVGYVIMDFLEKLEELMARDFGSTVLLAKVGEIVAERAREEAEVLREEGKVEDRMVTELSRVLKLMEMDLAMVSAAVKEETLNERLEQARARCRELNGLHLEPFCITPARISHSA
ncbi:protein CHLORORESPIRATORY REDUCTION 41, chloroplastic isoform X2 [Nicotiana sylvestris]|uniref:protein CHLORORESPIRATORY REDUCTION 41, chloroplastic isoform X2 n=1 Tax=Nicotiana sylvestris TaxID=4096 RepID=UPI00388C385F